MIRSVCNHLIWCVAAFASFSIYADCQGGLNRGVSGGQVYLHSVTVDAEARENIDHLLKGLGLASGQAGLRADAIARANSRGDQSTLKLCDQLQVGDNDNIKLSDEDVYNFGILRVKSLEHITNEIKGAGARTFVSVGLVWAHIGQESLVDDQEKLPEIRFTASQFEIGIFEDDSREFNESKMTSYYRRTYDAAVVKLLRKVSKRYKREVGFTKGSRQYVVVNTPSIAVGVIDTINANYSPLLASRMAAKLPLWLASYIEDRIVDGIQADARFSNLAVLPNVETSKQLLARWGEFTDMAKNNTKRSAVSANDSALNNKPVLRTVAPLCEWKFGQKIDGMIGVPGLSVKTKLVELTLDEVKKIQRGVYLYSMDSVLVGGVRIPLGHGLKARRAATDAKGGKLKTVVATYSNVRTKQASIAMNDWLGPDWLGWSLAHVAENIGDGIVERLALSLQQQPELSEISADNLQDALCMGALK